MLKSPYSARLFSENIRRRLIIATLMLQYSHKWTGIACSNFLPFLYFQQSSLSVLANLSWRRRLLGNLSIVSHLTWTVVSARCLSLILTLLCPSGSTSLSKMYRITFCLYKQPSTSSTVVGRNLWKPGVSPLPHSGQLSPVLKCKTRFNIAQIFSKQVLMIAF